MPNEYRLNYSSSPPSTPPGSRQSWKKPGSNPFALGSPIDHSTTPAGPPPSSAGSFTPAGPPPSSLFGSSQVRGQSLFETTPGFGESNLKSPKSRGTASPAKKGRSPKKSPKKSPYPSTALASGGSQLSSSQVSPQRSPGQVSGDDDYDEDEDEDYEPDTTEDESDGEYDDDEGASGEEYEEDVSGEEDMDMDAGGEEVEDAEEEPTARSTASPGFRLKSSIPYDWMAHAKSVEETQLPRGVKRSHRGAPISQTALYKPGTEAARKGSSVVSTIAKDISKQIGPSELEEPDDLILDTETYVSKTYPEVRRGQDPEELIEAALLVVPDTLCRLWQDCCAQTHSRNLPEKEYTIGIGPGDDLPSFHKATYVANLLLKLHHPPQARGKQAFAQSQANRPVFSSLVPMDSRREEAYPKILLDWLEANHNPYENALAGLKSYQPNPTAHASFWDIIFAAAVRGKARDIISILNMADFSYARTAREDNKGKDHYDQTQLSTIMKVVHQVLEVLRSCPSVLDDDWFVYGNEWVLFRRRVENALNDLSSFAEGRSRVRGLTSPDFDASDYGIKSRSIEFTESAQRAGSKVPWIIYQNVKAFYGVLLGNTAELLSSSQDWLEATIALAVWWDGDDDDGFAANGFSMSRGGSTRPDMHHSTRLVDSNPSVAYRKRLAAAFERVTNEAIDDALQIDPTNPVEVAIASIFEGDLEGSLGLLQAWSMPIAAAVVEIGSQGQWYESAPGVPFENDGFDATDLMVLNYGQTEQPLNKDGTLLNYSAELFKRGTLKHTRSRETKEGWELSLEILARLDDVALANEKIGGTIGRLPIGTNERADKLIKLCRTFGLEKDACAIAEKYASSIAETTDKYGTALIYYARAHSTKKVKDVLDLLISYCLVQSTAFPPASSLDPHLLDILKNPHYSLDRLAGLDPRASEILSIQMSGYATLRKFYELRDDQVDGERRHLRPAAIKKAAAASLLAVIASSADNIRGGLYDDNSPAVVPVDGLLVLLGEAMVFVDQPSRTLSLQQLLVLLRAIEDLQTVHARIQTQCVECLSSTLASAHGHAAPSDLRDLMKKSISDLTASTGFSLIGSSMLGSGKDKGKDGLRRGWDWRNDLQAGAGAQDIISKLRVGLARDVSKAWMDGEEV